MAGICAADAKEYLGKTVWYKTSWGYRGTGVITRVLGMGHVEIEESKGDSIITSIKNVAKTQDELDRLPVYA